MSENEVIAFLEGLTPADFSRILSRIPGAASQVPQGASHFESVSALLGYVRSSAGSGFGRLEGVLQELFPDKFPTPDDRPASNQAGPGIASSAEVLPAELRRLMTNRLSRSEVGTLWFNLFGTTLDNDLPGRSLSDTIIELLSRAHRIDKMPTLFVELNHSYPYVLGDRESGAMPISVPHPDSAIIPSGLIPHPLTTFIGREREIRNISTLLQAHRLVTIKGLGGVGKTRLAQYVADILREDYEGRVINVELAALRDEMVIVPTIASAIGLREDPGKSLQQALIERVISEKWLLILDNCEHLRKACRIVVGDLLHVCPKLRIMATSRAPLGAYGETIYHLQPFAVPKASGARLANQSEESDSVRLFEDRARSQRFDFRVTDTNHATIVDICRQVSGIPLAIELAAARVRSLSLQEIARRLESSFHLLNATTSDRSRGHQALETTIAWSYELLSESEKSFFRRLSVFSGGWTVEAAEVVCSHEPINKEEILELLTSLVDQSLLTFYEDDVGSRYGLLEIIRQFTETRFTTDPDRSRIQQQHTEYFVRLAEAADTKLRGPEQAQ